MLTLCESDAREGFHGSTDFYIQFNSLLSDSLDRRHHFSIVNVGPIIRLEVPLNVLVVDSDSFGI